ncbi:hypothetical protein I79_011373 [Cricetulus griseus]|uniref:Uncharacterized protein n=1 Tax=Cricetulus griseus TaxID=10029 RepID=G3HKZ0_CRIGR|nr:hypothetical protein I79_011373 [Cricetulus griseus]
MLPIVTLGQQHSLWLPKLENAVDQNFKGNTLPFANQSPPTPRKRKGPRHVWKEVRRRRILEMVENGSYISVFVVNFVFKIGKSPLAAKRE